MKVCEVEGDNCKLSAAISKFVLPIWPIQHSLSSLGRAAACCTRRLGPPLINGQFTPMMCSGVTLVHGSECVVTTDVV